MALQPKGHVRESDLFFPPALTKRKLSFSDKPEPRLRAYVRLRPLTTPEKHTDIHTTDTQCTIKLPKSSAQGALQNEEHTFTFDRVFDAHAAQRDVYEAAVLPQVTSLLEGRDSLTFAYGITNAGKTYTVQGVDTAAGQGMLPRTLNDVFAALAAQRAKMEPPPSALDPRAKYALRASFLEVYGNDAFDLLAPPERSFFGGEKSRRALKIKEGKGGVTVESLKEVELPDLETALATVRAGWKARQSASNGVNDSSSRSHAVLCLKLLHTAPGARKPTETRLYIVDLAGAERQKNTQSTGARLAEASHINNDLMVLGHCLRDLRWNQSHPKSNQRLAPFRSSRISMLFRDFLSGVGQTVVIAAINPRATDASSTLETLRFASVAQQIKTAGKPPVTAAAQDENNAHASNRFSVATVDDAVVVALQGQVSALRERLVEVEAERMADERRIREEVSAEMHKHLEETEEVMMQRLEEAQYETEEAYQKKLMLVKSAHKVKSSRKEAQSHDDMMQVHRLSQRKESASLARICELQSELQAARRDTARVTAELATALRSPERNGAPTPRTTAELNDAKARVAELQLAVAEASDARAAAEREQASAAAAADESRIMLVRAQASEEAALDQLKTEKFEVSRAVELAKAADEARLEAEVARDAALEALEKMSVDAEGARSLLSAEQEANGALRAELEAEQETNGVLRAELDAVREQLAAEALSHDSSRSHLEETLCNLRSELAAYKAPAAYAPAPGGAVVAAAEPSPRVQVSDGRSSSSGNGRSSSSGNATSGRVSSSDRTSDSILSPKRPHGELSVCRNDHGSDSSLPMSPAKRVRAAFSGSRLTRSRNTPPPHPPDSPGTPLVAVDDDAPTSGGKGPSKLRSLTKSALWRSKKRDASDAAATKPLPARSTRRATLAAAAAATAPSVSASADTVQPADVVLQESDESMTGLDLPPPPEMPPPVAPALPEQTPISRRTRSHVVGH